MDLHYTLLLNHANLQNSGVNDMEIDKILNDIQNKYGKIYGYEIIAYPRIRYYGGFMPCVKKIRIEKGFFLFEKHILLYCEKCVVVLQISSYMNEKKCREWLGENRIEKWKGISVDTPYYFYVVVTLILALILIFYIKEMTTSRILSLIIDIAIIMLILFAFVIPGIIFCYIYNKNRISIFKIFK